MLSKISLLLLSLVFVLISCQKTLEIEIPDFETSPVVNCLFSDDSIFVLKLTENKTLGDSIEMILADANCIIMQNDIIIDSLIFNDGFYYSTLIPEKGNNYKLEITTNEYEKLESQSYIPTDLNIFSIEQQDFSTIVNNNEIGGEKKLPLNRFSITFEDNPNEKNYYEIKIILKQFWNDSLYNHHPMPVYLFSQDNVIKKEDILDYSPQILVFSDSLFNGQTKTLDFLYKPLWLSIYGETEYTYGDYRLYYQFRAISKEMYDYRIALIKHVYNQQTDDFSIFGDPVQMISNIKNGYGVFAGYTEINDSIFIESTLFSF